MELGYNFFNRKELKSGVFPSVNDAVLSALGAYNQYNKLTLNERQEIINSVKKKLLDKVEEIAYMTVKETDMGNVFEIRFKSLLWQ